MTVAYDEKNTLFYRPLFPSHTKKIGAFSKNVALLGIGANQGNILQTFKKLLYILNGHSKIRVVKTSPLLRNPPFGFLEQDDFLNAVLAIETSYSASELLRCVLRIEKRLGRKRTFRNAPRVIDIDILFYKNQTITKKNLCIPHYDWQSRLSVLLPISLM